MEGVEVMLRAFLMAAVAICIGRLLWINRWPSKTYPPVVPRLPIIGNLLQLREKKPNHTFTQWARKYGPVYSIRTGATPMVVLNSSQLAKEDYERLVMFRGRCWRPKLETIMENDQKIKKAVLICSIIDRPGSAVRYTLPLVATDHVNYLWYTMEFNWARVVPGKTSYHTSNTTTVAVAGNG